MLHCPNFLFYGKSRIIKLAAGLDQRPNSLPVFYGVYPALLGLILPALLAGLWLFLETILLDRMLLSLIPEDILSRDGFQPPLHLPEYIIWQTAFLLAR